MRIVIVLIILCSCTPEARLNRLVKNNPHLLTKDTILVKDTSIIKGSVRDSSFIFSSDTIVISDSNQIIKYFYNNVTQKHYIKGEVKDRVIYKDIKVPYEKVIVQPLTWWQEYRDYIFLIILISILLWLVFKNK